MTLIIDTNGKKNRLLLFKNNKILSEKSWTVVFNRRRDVLVEINRLLEKNNVKLENLKQIIVYLGPGAYTSVRVGITIANIFGWSLDIPVIGIKGTKYNQELSTLDILKKVQTQIKKLKFSCFLKPVEPYYSTTLK